MALVVGTNCGFVASAPSADPTESNVLQDTRANAFADTSSATAVLVTEIGVWIDNATEEADITVGIYTDDPGVEPETLIGSATFAKGTAGGLWKSATGLSISISSNTKYWIAAQLDDTATATNTNYSAPAGAERALLVSQTTLPNPWGASDGADARNLAVYAKWEAAPAGNAGIMTTNTGFWGPTF